MTNTTESCFNTFSQTSGSQKHRENLESNERKLEKLQTDDQCGMVTVSSEITELKRQWNIFKVLEKITNFYSFQE